MPTQYLANSPAEIVSAVLLSLSIGTDPTPWASGTGSDYPVFVEGWPPTPDRCIRITDQAGQGDGQEMVTRDLLQHYGFQIGVRSDNHRHGRDVMETIRYGLSKNVAGLHLTMTGNDGASHTYLVWAITKLGEILGLGKETQTSKRSVFSLNGMIAVDMLS